jgi:hypothetical protein
MPWRILSATHKACVVNTSDLRFFQIILAQRHRDGCIVRLIEGMDDIYSFVKEAESIKKIESHGWIVARLRYKQAFLYVGFST